MLLLMVTAVGIISFSAIDESDMVVTPNHTGTESGDETITVFAVDTSNSTPNNLITSTIETDVKKPSITTEKTPETTQKTPQSTSKYPTVSVYINDKLLTNENYFINNGVYVELESFVNVVDQGTYKISGKTATVKTPTMDMTIKADSNYIEANGRYLYSGIKTLLLDGEFYLPYRLLAKAYGMEVKWVSSKMQAYMTGKPVAIEKGASFYKSDDVYWLSRIIHAESGGEPLKGKIAVGNVVLNRVKNKNYPNTIYGVIFDKKYGTQFSPVSYGTIYNTPSSESIIAAKICLDGYSLNEEMIYFINPKIATNFWITEKCTYVMKIGNHSFYK